MLELKNLYKTFHSGTPNEVRALQGVDFTLDDGSFTVIIGTNGSGKSTTLNAVAGNQPRSLRSFHTCHTHRCRHCTPISRKKV